MDWFKAKRRHKQVLPIKIMFQGFRKSGKSSVLSALEGETFFPDNYFGEENVNTIFQGTEIQTWIFQRRMYRVLLTRQYTYFDGVVCVIDSADKEGLHQALSEIDIFLLQQKSDAIVMMVLANKQDVEGALPVEFIEEKVKEKVSANQSTMKGKSVVVAGCSAITREGLEEAFSMFLKEIHRIRKEMKLLTQEKKAENRFLRKITAFSFVKRLLFH